MLIRKLKKSGFSRYTSYEMDFHITLEMQERMNAFSKNPIDRKSQFSLQFIFSSRM